MMEPSYTTYIKDFSLLRALAILNCLSGAKQTTWKEMAILILKKQTDKI